MKCIWTLDSQGGLCCKKYSRSIVKENVHKVFCFVLVKLFSGDSVNWGAGSAVIVYIGPKDKVSLTGLLTNT
jgi:hypothetical protein